jgi:hypothetical protein
LLATEKDEAVLRAARDLRRRIHAGPTPIYILLLSIGLLVFLAGYYWLQANPAP